MIVVFSLLDCALTLVGVSRMGIAYEANPLCAALLRISPVVFVLAKAAPALALFLLIRRHARFRRAYRILSALCAAASALNGAALLILWGVG